MLIRRSKVLHISARAYPLTVHTLKDALDRAVIEAGMKNLRVHDFRHTPAMRLVQAGEDLYRVKELVSIKRTEQCSHQYPESLRSSVATFDERHNLDTKQGQTNIVALAQ